MNRTRPHDPGGFALAASLMILALLSVLATAAIQSTTLEVKISAHDRDARLAVALAEAALEEARYYAARIWGRLGAPALLTPTEAQVPVESPLPPGTPWQTDLYRGFTLYDRTGRGFPVTANNADPAAPFLTVAVSGGVLPAQGRFSLVREIPAADVAGSRVSVPDTGWALVSPPDVWRGWVLWDAHGNAFAVAASDTDFGTTPARLVLDLSAPPGPGPYRLSRNPWLAALAAGEAPAGDADPASADRWDRAFTDPAGNVLGSASVRAEVAAPGMFRLVSVAAAAAGRGRAECRILRAGLPEQRLADWKVGHED